MVARTCVLAVVLLAPIASTAGEKSSKAGNAFFEAKVRPILSTHCFTCHGPKKQSADLRLDSRAALLEMREHGKAVVPGDPDKSLLIQAVLHKGELKMPQKEKLPPQAIEVLIAWVRMGAPFPEANVAGKSGASADIWKKHWAFQPVRKQHIPAVRDAAGSLTPIDAFIAAKLDAKGLQPSPPADRHTLIRRVTFDLIGLPPTPAEVEAFASDAAPNAFAKVVDRLLASPHYGERWGRHWLDVARYADTKGYVFFEEHNYPWAWTYRDYVIRAFNEDLPYDRFVREQLAADRLALGADRRPLTALGFLTLGGRFMNNSHDIIDDRIDVVTRGLMGLTVACARCHDHKYDPIPQADYYSLYGVFASCADPIVPPLFQSPPQTPEYAKFATQLQVREKKLTDFVQAKHAELVDGARKRAAEYLSAADALRGRPSTDDFMLIADTNDLNPTMIVRWQKYLQRMRNTDDPVFAAWHALAPLRMSDRPVKTPFGADVTHVLATLGADPTHQVNPIVVNALKAKPPKNLADLAKCYADVLHAAEKKWLEGKKAPLADPAEEQLRLVLYGPDAPANVASLPYGDLSLLPDRASQAKVQELRKALEQWRSTGPGAPPRAMAVVDLPVPFEPYVFLRGNPSNRGDRVPRQLPLLVAGAKRQPIKEGSGRLELANAIASPDNPLTARVLVNRLWLHHFGQGLVTTPSDFGIRSDPPSHPELLDWLADRFIADGWSLKKMHRLMVLSRTYRQKSDDRADGLAVDPENRLLWKMSRQRLDFEATRDALLAVAGKLDCQIGGPSVQNALAPRATRRTLYSFLDRLNVPGLFRTFDFPTPDATSPRRDNTTIAPQALFLMNHPLVMECARNILRRPGVVGELDPQNKTRRIYGLLFGRSPAPRELQLGRDYVAAGGGSALAWERYVHALLQTNEFAWID
jgi:hypothetical protein